MNDLATHLSGFLREHLPAERNASQHTCETYAYSFQLLVEFAAGRMKCKPSQLTLGQIDASMIMAFLEHIETKRGNCARTRNARLAAIKSFFRYLEYRLPAYLDQSRQIHAIPMKKTDQMLIDYLTREELKALLDSPDPHSKSGIRDRAMLHLAYACGLRVAELVSLRLDQFDPRTPATIHIVGKGRRERVLPLWRESAQARPALPPDTNRCLLHWCVQGRCSTLSYGEKWHFGYHETVPGYKLPVCAVDRGCAEDHHFGPVAIPWQRPADRTHPSRRRSQALSH